MLIGYGNYRLAVTISGSAPGAAFLTDPANMVDGRTGTVTSCRWPGGTQTTASFVRLTISVASPYESIPALGVSGLINVIGLPAGTLVRIGPSLPVAVSQRLTPGFRDELSAWVIPTSATTGTTTSIWIYNDVNGVASIPASASFAIGDVFVGRLVGLPTLLQGSPGGGMIDPTTRSISYGAQFNPRMRKVVRTQSATLGKFSGADAIGPYSSILDGGNPSQPISVRNLAARIAASPVVAFCAEPHDMQSPTLVSPGGYRFSPAVIQQSMMLAWPSQIGDVLMTDPPLYTWPLRFTEAT